MIKVSGSRSAVRRSVLEKSASIWPLAIGVTAGGLALDGLRGYLKTKALQAKRNRENRMHEDLLKAINASAQPKAVNTPFQPQVVTAYVRPRQAPMSRLARTGLFGGGGAGVGALIGDLTGGTPSERRRNAIIGAVLGGAAGSAVANTDKIKKFVAQFLPKQAAEAGQGPTPYERGFTDKCAELGVAPAARVKWAGLRGYLGATVGSAGYGTYKAVNGGKEGK